MKDNIDTLKFIVNEALLTYQKLKDHKENGKLSHVDIDFEMMQFKNRDQVIKGILAQVHIEHLAHKQITITGKGEIEAAS